MSNQTELRALMGEYQLTRPQTAELAGVSVYTLDAWLSSKRSKKHRNMPDRSLELIRLKLKTGD